MSVAAVVLAAGKGSRMRSTLPKPLVSVAGRPMVVRLIDSIMAAGIDDIVVVVGHGAEQVRAALPPEVRTVTQDVRDGTAGALDCARHAVADADEVVVFVGDSPLVSAASIRRLVRARRRHGLPAAFLTATFPISLPYARVIRSVDGRVADCIEEGDCTSEQVAVREYMTSHYAFSGAALWAVLSRVVPHLETGERYLTHVLRLLIADGGRVETVAAERWEELVGLNTPEEVAWAEGVLV